MGQLVEVTARNRQWPPGTAQWRRRCFKEALTVHFVAWGLGPIFPPKEVTPGMVLQKPLHSVWKHVHVGHGLR